MIALTVAAIMALSLATVALSEVPKGKIVISVGGKKDATYDHATHAAREATCQVCHHTDQKGKEQKCSVCHTVTGKDKAEPAKKAFHKRCGGCHKERSLGPLYPKNCKGCHSVPQ